MVTVDSRRHFPVDAEARVASDRVVLDLRRYELRRGRRVLRLERQPMELLILLARRNGELVTREEIEQHLWGEEVPLEADRGINNAVRKLRLALHDDSKAPRFLETVIGKGYRLIGSLEVIPVSAEMAETQLTQISGVPLQPRAPWLRRLLLTVAAAVAMVGLGAGVAARMSSRGQSHASTPIRSLVVLPFANISGDPAQDYFSDGMTDELITNLGRYRALRVISRTSAMHFKRTGRTVSKIANDLGVEAVVEGSVYRSQGRVRVTARLIRARDEAVVWERSYERDLDDILALQATMTQDIASQIAQEVAAGPPIETGDRTFDANAYEDYLRGRALWDQSDERSVRNALRAFQRSLSRDAGYAPAALGVAECNLLLYTYGYDPPGHAVPAARRAAEEALRIDPSLGEARATIALLEVLYDRDPAAAGSEFEQALRSSPNSALVHRWDALYLGIVGRLPEALVEIDRARALDPLETGIEADKARLLTWSRHPEEAIQLLRHALAAGASDYGTHWKLARAYQLEGMPREAVEEYAAALAADGEPELAVDVRRAYPRGGFVGSMKAWLDRASVDAEPIPSYTRGLLYEEVGDDARAVEWFARAVGRREPRVCFLAVDPNLDALRRDSRFMELLGTISFRDPLPPAAHPPLVAASSGP